MSFFLLISLKKIHFIVNCHETLFKLGYLNLI